jgi:tetratricopeptide (TPR) repeat protein
MHFKTKNFAKAAEDFAKCVELRPNDAVLYANLGSAYLESGQYEQAIQILSKALSIDRNDVLSYMSRGDAYLAHGDKLKAAEDYKRVTSMARDAGLKNIAEQRLAELGVKK